MSDNCCGVSVPPVPERPIDLTQPAYVLLDGQWVLLTEIINAYLPPVTPKVVLRMEHVVVNRANVATIAPAVAPANSNQLTAVQEWVPSTPTSRLLIQGTATFEQYNPASTTAVVTNQAVVGMKHQTNTGVWPADTSWVFKVGAWAKHAFIGAANDVFAFQLDIGPAERRSDDGKWAVAMWGQQQAGSTIRVEALADPRFTYIEYEPA